MFSKFIITSCVTANLARKYLHTLGNAADVLTHWGNPLRLFLKHYENNY